MPSDTKQLRDFYDVTRAADAAARWPLLQELWVSLGGERLAPAQANTTKLHVSPPPAPPAETQPADDVAGTTEPGTAGDAPSLEDLFSRLR